MSGIGSCLQNFAFEVGCELNNHAPISTVEFGLYLFTPIEVDLGLSSVSIDASFVYYLLSLIITK